MEMALAMPLLVMMAFGVADYGEFVYLKNTFQAAASAGARAAIPSTATNTTLTGATGVITTMMSAAGISSSNYTVTTTPTSISGAAAGTAITVTITGNWSTLGTHVLPPCFGGIAANKQIIGAAVMIREN